MNQPRSSPRHLAFFEALASTAESSAEWRAATAGLVTLRLVDAWVEEGPEVVRSGSWSVTAVREAIAELDAGDPARDILAAVVGALERAPGGDAGIVTARLMAYARALDFEAKWRLAADVYHSVIAHTHPLADSDIAAEANMRVGYCSRMLGEWQAAAEAYGRAGQIAQASGDPVGVLRSQIGQANLARDRGNMPRAEEILDRTIEEATARGLREVRAVALHDRATVAHYRQDFELAVRLAYEALAETTVPLARDRLLADIATQFAALGVRSAARDAHLILAATAQEQFSRWSSMLSLLEMAVVDRFEPVFEQYRRELADVALPPELQVLYHLYVGRGLQMFGRTDQARAALQTAVDLAERAGLHRHSFTAEQALGALREGVAPPRVAAAEAPAGLRDVAGAIQEMRSAAGIAG